MKEKIKTHEISCKYERKVCFKGSQTLARVLESLGCGSPGHPALGDPA